MNELRYQLDLMRAMNQKLSAKERMYRLLCDTMDYAYIYYSFESHLSISVYLSYYHSSLKPFLLQQNNS